MVPRQQLRCNVFPDNHFGANRVVHSVPNNRPIAIDAFSGAGGLSEGLLAAGIHVAVAVEKHPHAALTCAFNHPETTIVCDDLDRISTETLEKLVEERAGAKTVDIVAGGPPCQGFSPAGRRDPNDPRNTLFRHFLRLVEHFKPRMFLFENVPGFAELYVGHAIKTIVSEFRRLGYEMHDVADAECEDTEEFTVLDAASYGVPQHRYRLFLVGWLRGQLDVEFAWPNATHGPEHGGMGAYLTAEEALGDLEFLSAGRECHAYMIEPTSDYQVARRKNSAMLFNHLATKHRAETVRMYRHLRPGSTIRSIPEHVRSGKQTMSRLDPSGCSKAVLALPDDLVHYRRHRIPTVREMARLQSFDDDFVFLGKRTTSDKSRRVDVPQYTQVGNAVPPLLARAVGVAILRSLGMRSKDLRDLRARRSRHEWLRGSSAFSGYELSPEAAGKVHLLDSEGRALPLPICSTGAPLIEAARIADWTGRHYRRARDNGHV